MSKKPEKKTTTNSFNNIMEPAARHHLLRLVDNFENKVGKLHKRMDRHMDIIEKNLERNIHGSEVRLKAGENRLHAGLVRVEAHEKHVEEMLLAREARVDRST